MKEKSISIEEVQTAYTKYKSSVYYDSNELFQRRKLAEFESGLSGGFPFWGDTEYAKGLLNLSIKLEERLEKITSWINDQDLLKEFNPFLDKINMVFLPKQFTKREVEPNFISNQRIQDNYHLEKTIVVADIPVELHLVVVLWLMRYGHKLDAALSSCCMGNRLLINKDKKAIVKGSGLFKPYFKQYQKWRDDAVEEAARKLENGNNVAFLSLDLKEFFHSVKLDFTKIEAEIWGQEGYKGGSNLHDIFKELHFRYTAKFKSLNYPNKEFAVTIGNACVLPVGIASSYVIGNYYLKDWDRRVQKLIPQVYYSRYVDDILMVFENPDINFHQEEPCENIRFSFEKYKAEASEDISFGINDLSKIEQFILETFHPLVKLIDFPSFLRFTDQEKESRIFQISCVEGAYFQSKKTLLHFFDRNESTTVIDKLKHELEERASEFRDFPDEEADELSFNEQVYHLSFDGLDEQMSTLQEYRENKFGLSVYLANKIFIALRTNRKVDYEETQKILKLFKGKNNLEFFRLWEKVFTFFLVNNDANGFVEFYKHTFLQIEKMRSQRRVSKSTITHHQAADSLLNYFDVAVELTLALFPNFFNRHPDAKKNIEIFHSSHKDRLDIYDKIQLTLPDDPYMRRFRTSNLIRHHYVAHPLMNYTKASNNPNINFCAIHPPKNDNKFGFEKSLLHSSPRMVKYRECCIAIVNKFMYNQEFEIKNQNNPRYFTPRIESKGTEDNNPQDFLDSAFELYEEINEIHFSSNRPKQEDFFTLETNKAPNSNPEVEIREITFQSSNLFNRPIKISLANTQVSFKNMEASIKGKPTLNNDQFQTFAKLLKESREEKTDLFILPENSTPYPFIYSLSKYSQDNQIALVAGLEHWNVNKVVFNFLVTIIPVSVNGIRDAVVLYRLKNHYSHGEELTIKGFGYHVPKPTTYRYDLINWQNLYFTSFYCFELADSFHRSLFRAKIDLLVASEWNKDTPYFSNIVESLSRDLHCYIAQANTSQYGDSRLTQPTQSARKDIMKLKGGTNDTILVEEIDLQKLREFQLKYYERTKADQDNSFKPLPPDWDRETVQKRIDNEQMFQQAKIKYSLEDL